MNVSWVNKTFYEVVYGESYDIEREQNGKWSSCAINGLYFTAIGYELRKIPLKQKAILCQTLLISPKTENTVL